MARRSALAAAVVDLLDREDLDALAYPTMRHETALIGAAPTGATCFLSAHTGLPALTIPAGFTTGGLPVGLELLGRALDDHRLVAFAFAHEAAHPKRRAPLRTPALLNGAAPAPVRIATDPPSGDGLEAALALDLANGALSYRIVVPDLADDDVYGAVLRRTPADDEGGPVVVQRLAGPGMTDMEGAVALSPRLLRDLTRGDLELLVHTSQGIRRRALHPSDSPRR